MIADFAITPIGVGESLGAEIAEAIEIVEQSGIPYRLHAMGTNLEGDWDEVMAVIKACRDRLLERSHRVTLSIRIDDRLGVSDGLTRKVASARRSAQ